VDRNPENNLWQLDVGDYPTAAPIEQKLRFLVGYATLAPSGHNTQPWQFGVNGNAIFVLADRSRALRVVDPTDRELVISCGAAIGTLEVAARRFGLNMSVTLLPDDGNPEHLAQIAFSEGEPPDGHEIALFDAIQARRTNRTAYFMEPLPNELMNECNDAVADSSTDLKWIEGNDAMEAVAGLVAEGDQIQFDDPAFRRELASWVRSSVLGSRDGMSGKGFGMPDILSPVGRFAIRTFDLGDSVAAADQKKILSGSPALALLSSTTDDPDSWVNTGRALARVLLTLTAKGHTASYLNQPIEIEALRLRLAEAIEGIGYPQILLRVGRSSDEIDPSVRRELSDVIVM
jgi:nitroreductase